MVEIINLRKRRKQRDRTQKERKAEENRARFGRSKAQKALDKSTRERADAVLDGHEIKPRPK